MLLLLPATPAVSQMAPPAAVATRVTTAPRIDGVLDDAMWAAVPVISDFVQREPVDGAPPSERTEVRIAYDEGHLYFGFVLHDSQPELIRRSILHREGRIDQDDHIWIGLDTYNDDRNAYIFELNSFGTQGDALFNDESMTLDDWNWEGVYESEARGHREKDGRSRSRSRSRRSASRTTPHRRWESRSGAPSGARTRRCSGPTSRRSTVGDLTTVSQYATLTKDSRTSVAGGTWR